MTTTLLRIALVVVALACSGNWPAQAGEARIPLTLATATPGGGFPLYGDAAAAVINETDPGLEVVTRNTKGSLENIPLLERGEVDIALVAGIPAYEALAGIGREPTRLKVVAAMYADFGLFAVSATSSARTVHDLIGQPIAWGTPASGLTALAAFAMDGLGLDRDRDFRPVLLERAGEGPGMLARGEVAAIWGGGIGWPNFRTVTDSGGRLIGFAAEDVKRIVAKHAFLTPLTVPAGAFPGQGEPINSFGSWSLILARADLSDDVAYRLAKALDRGNAGFAARLPQAHQSTPGNTLVAARERARIHPGVERYLREIGR